MAALDVPDLNLWLALIDPDHTHHARARHYWENEAAPDIGFCGVTMLGLLRLLTNSRVMHGAPFTSAEAWDAYRAFAGASRGLFCRGFPRRRNALRTLEPRPWFSRTPLDRRLDRRPRLVRRSSGRLLRLGFHHLLRPRFSPPAAMIDTHQKQPGNAVWSIAIHQGTSTELKSERLLGCNRW